MEITNGECCVEMLADEMEVLVVSLTAVNQNQSVRFGMRIKNRHEI